MTEADYNFLFPFWSPKNGLTCMRMQLRHQRFGIASHDDDGAGVFTTMTFERDLV
jgi:hypothetical protein